ncbi:hypothetical protein AN396_08960 [Candidatus Epulonipiscium fishelsonii]|uniref:Uncharacterized protein n=1 Tax=Candidatus Epulonipiscium fishelsonii TaxID=77094 RepID=A0ACC8XA47_9FIRM|nr:hypothetical protein AN396_08960 [Epulopiscium sp. SCG-B11WGA-EpuloA1]
MCQGQEHVIFLSLGLGGRANFKLRVYKLKPGNAAYSACKVTSGDYSLNWTDMFTEEIICLNLIYLTFSHIFRHSSFSDWCQGLTDRRIQ